MADLGSTVITHGDKLIVFAKGKRLELTETADLPTIIKEQFDLTEQEEKDLLRRAAKVLKTMKDTR